MGEAAQLLGSCKITESSDGLNPCEEPGNGIKKVCTVVSADSGEWSEEQEAALVKAMKQFGKELEDRWERVSEVVPGKSKVQCFKRFKELRELFRSKKGGTGGENPTE